MGRDPAAALESYSILLHRLAADLELRHASMNIDSVAAPLRRVRLHVDGERAAVARLQDRATKQRARASQADANSR